MRVGVVRVPIRQKHLIDPSIVCQEDHGSTDKKEPSAPGKVLPGCAEHYVGSPVSEVPAAY